MSGQAPSGVPLLTIDSLQVQLPVGGRLRTVLHDVSFSIAAGEALGLVGESGSGKSMTARAVARLTHRNIPEIFDFSSSEQDRSYIVAELVDGHSLGTLLREGPPMLPELGAMMVVGVARARQRAQRSRRRYRRLDCRL